MTVPIATSPGRSGFGPQLALSYNSGSGNGVFGFGWSLSTPSITRKTDKGLPQYRDADESDVFILSGAEDLVPVYRQDPDGSWVAAHHGYQRSPDGFWVSDPSGQLVVHEDEIDGYRVRRYRPRIEGLFARIERWSKPGSTLDMHWRSISKENVLTLYGLDGDSRIVDPLDGSRIFTWLISETRDDKGNAVLYRYKAEDGLGLDLGQAHEQNRGPRDDERRTANRYLKRIHYGNRTSLLDETGHRPRFLDTATVDTQIANANWMFEVVFDYGDHDEAVPKPGDDAETEAAGQLKHPWPNRVDPFSSYRSGFEIRTSRLCQRVLMFHHFPNEDGVGRDCLVRSTDFTYSDERDPADVRNPVYTFLRACTQTAYRRNNGGYDSRSLPPIEFGYTDPVVQDTVEQVDPTSLENLPVGLDGSAYRWTDLHGEGIPGILAEQAGAWYYKRNLSPMPEKHVDGQALPRAQFAPIETVALKPNVALGDGAEFMDLAGDGQPDLVVMAGLNPGLFEHDDGESWESFRPFTSHLNRDTHDPNLKFVDLDGDGHADILISEDDAFAWHTSLGEEGFGPAQRVAKALDEENGPHIVFADGTQSIYVADLSGDGLSDIVRIRNGEVCYWPNLGYGRFGAKIAMDNAPWFDDVDQFDQKRIRLADIDGSGTTDIIYLHRDGVRLYFNQSGNGWSQAQPLHVFPRIDDVVNIIPIDLLGNGTACLVWSSSEPGDTSQPMRYVNLMGGKKPHLLAHVVNNLGAETSIVYAPSTRFYLQDKYDGRPWITRLPFPVHVVERVVTDDLVSRNRFVTRYSYHHGYFDGVEREFRGFGFVEQWDTEEYDELQDATDIENVENIDQSSYVPPVYTKTWVHTGVYVDRNRVSTFFAGPNPTLLGDRYYREPGWFDDDDAAHRGLLPDTLLPRGLSADEEREACRALKGMMLRQEVYALDDHKEKQDHPYIVTEQNFAIECVQRHEGNRHGVFFTHARESLSYHYERNPTDPRVGHDVTLDVDEYGNVLRSVAIGYPRAAVPERQPEQNQTHLTLTLSRVANLDDDPDWRHIGLPVEMATYEVVKPPSTGQHLEWQALHDLCEALIPAGQFAPADAMSVPIEQWDWRKTWDQGADPGGLLPDGTTNSRLRPMARTRTRYRPDDFGDAQHDVLALLALGAIESRALVGEQYRLAFTDSLVSAVFADKVTAAILHDEGGYVHLAGDANWWASSGRIFYSPDPNATPAQERDFARQHFFLPHRFRDPFHSPAMSTETIVSYDDYSLLPLETRDALGNRVTIGARQANGSIDANKPRNDYRVLQPRLLSDANGDRTEVVFDILGMTAGRAVSNIDGSAGDNLDEFDADLADAQVDAFFDAPDPHTAAAGLLKNATTRIIYDLNRFQRSRQAHPDDLTQWLPAYAATLATETHHADPGPPNGRRIAISFSYSDGFSREIQKKVQAEPGPVVENGPDVDPRWVASGWTIFNNKGKPVRQYEPFFSKLATKGHQFEFGVLQGASSILFYDPLERLVATLHPDDTYEKVVFDPWQQSHYDVNDTAAPRNTQTGDPRTDPDIEGYVAGYVKTLPDDWKTWYQRRSDGSLGAAEQNAAAGAEIHADTPAISHFDVLGRTFLTVSHNRYTDFFTNGNPEVSREIPNRVEFDGQGNQRVVRDASVQNGDQLGRVVMGYDYNLLGKVVHQQSMEAGERWMLEDVLGKPIRNWDSRAHSVRTQYDQLRRPLRVYVTGADPNQPDDELLVERLAYGEQHPQAAELHLRGKLFLHLDQAGLFTNDQYDFKGSLLRASRRLAKTYDGPLDWRDLDETAGLWPQNPADTLDLDALNVALAAHVDDESFNSSNSYDALERVVQLTAPHSDQPGTKLNVIQPVYNEAGLLEQVDVWLGRDAEPGQVLDPAVDAPSPVAGVKNIDYNAKGQRLVIEYKNGASTSYQYDDTTFRLTQLTSNRPANLNGLAQQLFKTTTTLQDLHYTYDPIGNITEISDDALPIIVTAGENVVPVFRYAYDALYRLMTAQGREHIDESALLLDTANGANRDYGFAGLSQANNPRAIRNYADLYQYDDAGNFLKMKHTAKNGGWLQSYAYDETSLIEDGSHGTTLKTSNRLSSTSLGTDHPTKQPYLYDAHGNIIRMAHLTHHADATAPNMYWDYKDQLCRTDPPGTGSAFYTYGADGQRVRKVWQKAPGLVEERIYLGGFEVFRKRNGNGDVKLERETLHVMDDKQRIALIETRTKDDGQDPAPEKLIRYQLGNHLGSASLELDDKAQVISYEEYYPYGCSAFQAVRSQTETPKRYRYTGKERDEESGFSYHGARYYAPWLGRWTSCDPAGLVDGPNRYEYVTGNPVKRVDPNGKWGVEMHFAGVYWSGRAAGASHAQALRAALASESLDDFAYSAAPDMKENATFAPGSVRRWQMNRANNSHALNVTKEESGFVASAGIATKDVTLFGLGLHTVGDYLPHANLSGEATFGHQSGVNEDYSTSQMWSHDADYTYRNPQKALATFERFRSMWSDFRGSNGPKPSLSDKQLANLSKFIYARDWNEMSKALHAGLLAEGVTPDELKEVESYMNGADGKNGLELRQEAWNRILQSPDGQRASRNAGNLWDFIKQGKNTQLFNSTKIDISSDLNGLPSMPVDPRFTQEKQRNKQIYEQRRELNRRGFL